MNGGSLPLKALIYGHDDMCTIVSFMGASINSRGLKSLMSVMAIQVVEFSDRGYKIRKIFA